MNDLLVFIQFLFKRATTQEKEKIKEVLDNEELLKSLFTALKQEQLLKKASNSTFLNNFIEKLRDYNESTNLQRHFELSDYKTFKKTIHEVITPLIGAEPNILNRSNSASSSTSFEIKVEEEEEEEEEEEVEEEVVVIEVFPSPLNSNNSNQRSHISGPNNPDTIEQIENEYRKKFSSEKSFFKEPERAPGKTTLAFPKEDDALLFLAEIAQKDPTKSFKVYHNGVLIAQAMGDGKLMDMKNGKELHPGEFTPTPIPAPTVPSPDTLSTPLTPQGAINPLDVDNMTLSEVTTSNDTASSTSSVPTSKLSSSNDKRYQFSDKIPEDESESWNDTLAATVASPTPKPNDVSAKETVTDATAHAPTMPHPQHSMASQNSTNAFANEKRTAKTETNIDPRPLEEIPENDELKNGNNTLAAAAAAASLTPTPTTVSAKKTVTDTTAPAPTILHQQRSMASQNSTNAFDSPPQEESRIVNHSSKTDLNAQNESANNPQSFDLNHFAAQYRDALAVLKIDFNQFMTQQQNSSLSDIETSIKNVLRAAYIAQALEKHPDKNRQNPGATAEFQIIQNAYNEVSEALEKDKTAPSILPITTSPNSLRAETAPLALQDVSPENQYAKLEEIPEELDVKFEAGKSLNKTASVSTDKRQKDFTDEKSEPDFSTNDLLGLHTHLAENTPKPLEAPSPTEHAENVQSNDPFNGLTLNDSKVNTRNELDTPITASNDVPQTAARPQSAMYKKESNIKRLNNQISSLLKNKDREKISTYLTELESRLAEKNPIDKIDQIPRLTAAIKRLKEGLQEIERNGQNQGDHWKGSNDTLAAASLAPTPTTVNAKETVTDATAPAPTILHQQHSMASQNSTNAFANEERTAKTEAHTEAQKAEQWAKNQNTDIPAEFGNNTNARTSMGQFILTPQEPPPTNPDLSLTNVNLPNQTFDEEKMPARVRTNEKANEAANVSTDKEQKDFNEIEITKPIQPEPTRAETAPLALQDVSPENQYAKHEGEAKAVQEKLGNPEVNPPPIVAQQSNVTSKRPTQKKKINDKIDSLLENNDRERISGYLNALNNQLAQMKSIDKTPQRETLTTAIERLNDRLKENETKQAETPTVPVKMPNFSEQIPPMTSSNSQVNDTKQEPSLQQTPIYTTDELLDLNAQDEKSEPDLSTNEFLGLQSHPAENTPKPLEAPLPTEHAENVQSNDPFNGLTLNDSKVNTRNELDTPITASNDVPQTAASTQSAMYRTESNIKRLNNQISSLLKNKDREKISTYLTELESRLAEKNPIDKIDQIPRLTAAIKRLKEGLQEIERNGQNQGDHWKGSNDTLAAASPTPTPTTVSAKETGTDATAPASTILHQQHSMASQNSTNAFANEERTAKTEVHTEAQKAEQRAKKQNTDIPAEFGKNTNARTSMGQFILTPQEKTHTNPDLSQTNVNLPNQTFAEEKISSQVRTNETASVSTDKGQRDFNEIEITKPIRTEPTRAETAPLALQDVSPENQYAKHEGEAEAVQEKLGNPEVNPPPIVAQQSHVASKTPTQKKKINDKIDSLLENNDRERISGYLNALNNQLAQMKSIDKTSQRETLTTAIERLNDRLKENETKQPETPTVPVKMPNFSEPPMTSSNSQVNDTQQEPSLQQTPIYTTDKESVYEDEEEPIQPTDSIPTEIDENQIELPTPNIPTKHDEYIQKTPVEPINTPEEYEGIDEDTKREDLIDTCQMYIMALQNKYPTDKKLETYLSNISNKIEENPDLNSLSSIKTELNQLHGNPIFDQLKQISEKLEDSFGSRFTGASKKARNIQEAMLEIDISDRIDLEKYNKKDMPSLFEALAMGVLPTSNSLKTFEEYLLTEQAKKIKPEDFSYDLFKNEKDFTAPSPLKSAKVDSNIPLDEANAIEVLLNTLKENIKSLRYNSQAVAVTTTSNDLINHNKSPLPPITSGGLTPGEAFKLRNSDPDAFAQRLNECPPNELTKFIQELKTLNTNAVPSTPIETNSMETLTNIPKEAQTSPVPSRSQSLLEEFAPKETTMTESAYEDHQSEEETSFEYTEFNNEERFESPNPLGANKVSNKSSNSPDIDVSTRDPSDMGSIYQKEESFGTGVRPIEPTTLPSQGKNDGIKPNLLSNRGREIKNNLKQIKQEKTHNNDENIPPTNNTPT